MSIKQSPPGVLWCQLRRAAHLWRLCSKALPIDVRPYKPPLGFIGHDLVMICIGSSACLYSGRAKCD